MKQDLIIIGGGAAGLTAAIYASRASLHPVVLAGPLPGGNRPPLHLGIYSVSALSNTPLILLSSTNVFPLYRNNTLVILLFSIISWISP